MIPKVIHYCWFGNNPKPELAIRCINSWKKYFPDYEIKEWNESNFDVNACLYSKQAYEAKKWAFVSDYARFKILYENGGIYFDTDVEVLKDMTALLENGPFMGLEAGHDLIEGSKYNTAVAAGLGLAAEAGMDIYKEILEYYQKESFFYEDGSINLTTIVIRISEMLENKGIKLQNEITTCCGLIIYPEDYFCSASTV